MTRSRMNRWPDSFQFGTSSIMAPDIAGKARRGLGQVPPNCYWFYWYNLCVLLAPLTTLVWEWGSAGISLTTSELFPVDCPALRTSLVNFTSVVSECFGVTWTLAPSSKPLLSSGNCIRKRWQGPNPFSAQMFWVEPFVVRACLGYNPWDQATRQEGEHWDTLAELLKETGGTSLEDAVGLFEG